MPAEEFDEQNLNKQAILRLIKKHQIDVVRLRKMKDYYEGKHKILGEEKENKLVCNHSKDIADTASAYFIGNPISYKSKDDITDLLEALENAGADEVDGDNGLDLSVYGRAYEYIYTKENETYLTIKNLSPENTFMVYDDTIEQKELFAVYYYSRKDDTKDGVISYIATVLTKNYKYTLNIWDNNNKQLMTEESEEHYAGEVPIIEYFNNKMAIGDYELQIPLIDAYNVLMSDRVTDKEQFIDAILALYGVLLGDEDTDEDGENKGSNAMKQLKKEKLLELPADAKAEYLTRTFDEAGVEILKKAIEQDIHKFSHVPCLTDEAFGGNVSGVAMEFKLLGLENITKIKTRYYKKGLRKRLRIFTTYINKYKAKNIEMTGITPTFTRALPKNLVEISQIVSNLWGKVSRKTLLSQIPFVEDVEAELEAVENESREAIEQQKELFGNEPNNLPEDDVDGGED